MNYRKLDQNGDMLFGNGSLDFYDNNVQGVAQAISTTLRLWQGEWYLDLTAGIPYSGAGLGKNKELTLPVIIREGILGVEGVLSLQSFDYVYDPNLRQASIRVEANTVYGIVVFEGIF